MGTRYSLSLPRCFGIKHFRPRDYHRALDATPSLLLSLLLASKPLFSPSFPRNRFPRTEQDSPPLSASVWTMPVLEGFLLYSGASGLVPFCTFPISFTFHFYHRASSHCYLPRARPHAQCRAPYDYSVILDFGHHCFIVHDTVWSVAGSTT